MKEVVRMWKYSNMIALTAISSGIYIAALIPFKSIPLIPGFTEIRPGSLLPVIFGLLFGPAGAWGAALGNLIADFFGTYSIVSVFGFFANFIYAYIPYKLWCRLGIFRYEDKLPTINSAKKLLEFGFISIAASTACALVISWGSETVSVIPFATSCIIITLNNTVITMVLGPIFLPLLYSCAKKYNLIWTDIMDSKDITKPRYPRVYSWMIITAAIGGVITGLWLSIGIAHQAVFVTSVGLESSRSLLVSLGILPFLIIMVFGMSKL